MPCTQQSRGTAEYLCRFRKILAEMISGMTSVSLTDSLSHNFIVQMIPHHEAAIQMSQNILQYAPCAPLREIAQNIITEQAKSIEDMREALPTCETMKNDCQDIRRYRRRYHQITQTMFREMGNAPADCNLNADFMREMIPHHIGAIRMSKNALCFPICPELYPILQAIITSQKKGVREMQQLLQCI